jgi:hypothetical protein
LPTILVTLSLQASSSSGGDVGEGKTWVKEEIICCMVSRSRGFRLSTSASSRCRRTSTEKAELVRHGGPGVEGVRLLFVKGE